MKNLYTRAERLLRGESTDSDLRLCFEVADEVERRGRKWLDVPAAHLEGTARELRLRAANGADAEELLLDVFALCREIAAQRIGLRAYREQIAAGVGLHRGRVVEMQTGEGKTLAAIAPAILQAITGGSVHVLTFNDYLARRDASWMEPVYAAFGLRVAAVQENMVPAVRRCAYAADVTYATAKQAGFDFLRDSLAYQQSDLLQRPFHFAIIDEADSILIDEARVPLVIADDDPGSSGDFIHIHSIVASLREDVDWERDAQNRNAQLTEQGIARLEAELGCENLHAVENESLLSRINLAIHAQALLRRDVDYIVRAGRIYLVDELTGRVVADRRWPGGLQAALEAKEGLSIQSGARILNSITMQHFLGKYPRIAGMTGTARLATAELAEVYGLQALAIPTHRPCIRIDREDSIFTHREAKEEALVAEIVAHHRNGRPVLVGTSSVEESEELAQRLHRVGVYGRVLNAKNDETEARAVEEAGDLGGVTISTNMAGRGTDIRLGGADQSNRLAVFEKGGLLVLGTGRQQSRRIDDQLRGRAGRQGDPGASRLFVSLDDPILIRGNIQGMLPARFRHRRQSDPLNSQAVNKAIRWGQRRLEADDREIRMTLARYAKALEMQRVSLFEWRQGLLLGLVQANIFSAHLPENYRELSERVDAASLAEVERVLTLRAIDCCWSEHLAFVAEVREGIHLVGIGGLDPYTEFYKQVSSAYVDLHVKIERRAVEALATFNFDQSDIQDLARRAPSATWTYMVNDSAVSELHRMLHGSGSGGFAAAAILMAGPVLLLWGGWRLAAGMIRRRK